MRYKITVTYAAGQEPREIEYTRRASAARHFRAIATNQGTTCTFIQIHDNGQVTHLAFAQAHNYAEPEYVRHDREMQAVRHRDRDAGAEGRLNAPNVFDNYVVPGPAVGADNHGRRIPRDDR
jgi:hypothetical protein